MLLNKYYINSLWVFIYLVWVNTLTTIAVPVLCKNLPPGLTRLRSGIDVTKVSFLPIDLASSNGYTRAVVDYTCDENKVWTSPYKIGRINNKLVNTGNLTKPGTRQLTYQIPDQVESINNVPGGLLSAMVSEYRDYEEVKKSMAIDAGVGLLNGMFSASTNYMKAQHTIANSSKFVTEIFAHFSALQADLVPYWELPLGKSPSTFIDKFLPDKYEANPAKFIEFIETFGTHFISRGHYGGVFRLSFNLQNQLRYTMSDTQIKADAKGTFFNILKANGAYGGETVKITESFKSQSELTEFYYGGIANLLKPASWKDWWDSVSGNPWLFKGQLEPITKLIPDGPKNVAITKAIEIYLDKAYLNDILRSAYSFISKAKIGADQVLTYVTRTQELLAQVIPDHRLVGELGSQVKEYIETPEWFYQAKLCYSWYPDGDGGQCSASDRLLCAMVNSMTPWYRDDTDQRGGGCRMKWGIVQQGLTPNWFNQVQICFRWHPDGDGGQCGGGAPPETCAPVGQYTAEYRDDTDRRGGGCQMSWRLVAPANAPGWLLNAKLCFNWYPDGDGGQCAAPARNLCALVNQWTAYYRDDTDRRSGGCQMSWGIQT